ncbi:unnamed protein product [Acanthosepion pharaonis]|uniref:Cytochrome P450 n=1 Tax=Acanthosepion pharaonis TaxID=158019 RepID=A0A812CEX1_ACAPH|nr:unnamed protein product [Sepia pharaonis]
MFPYLNTSYAVNYKKQIEKVNNTVYSVIKKQREALKELSDEFQVTNLLASLLMTKDEETGDKMDDTQIRDEVMTFMLAGHETTGITLNWCLLEAARHPEMQQKIRDELNSVIAHGNSLSYDHLEKLTYTKCFIQETLRMYPAAPALGRQAVEDNYLHGYLIPKGTNVFIDINVIHKNPKYWDEPYEFRPESQPKVNSTKKATPSDSSDPPLSSQPSTPLCREKSLPATPSTSSQPLSLLNSFMFFLLSSNTFLFLLKLFFTSSGAESVN